MERMTEELLATIEQLEEENKKLKEDNNKLQTGPYKYSYTKKLKKQNEKLEEENKKLKEFKTKREESMFYFKAQMERAEPKTAREAEDLQKAKELFEKLYREELYYLEKENKNLKEELSAYDREYFDEDKKAKNIFKEDDTYVYDAKQVRDIC